MKQKQKQWQKEEEMILPTILLNSKSDELSEKN
jgi:hypothetical protein